VKKDLATRFDYRDVPESVGGKLRRIQYELQQQRKVAIKTAVEVGRQLHEAQKLLANQGQFGAWCRDEADISRAGAYQYINLAKVFGDLVDKMAVKIDITAAIDLARDSTPTNAQAEAKKILAGGGHIDGSRARELISNVKRIGMDEHHQIKHEDAPVIQDQEQRCAACQCSYYYKHGAHQ
jgi:GTP cyclohydrolase III